MKYFWHLILATGLAAGALAQSSAPVLVESTSDVLLGGTILNPAGTPQSTSPQQAVSGRVTGPDGQPVDAAEVAIYPRTSWTATFSNGTYSVTGGMPRLQWDRLGKPMLVLRSPSRNLAACESFSEDATNLDISLKPALTITGVVRGPDGPLADAEIRIRLKANRLSDDLLPQPARTDSQGRYELKCLPTDVQYLVYASAKDHGRSQVTLDEEPGTNRLEVEPLTLRLADQVVAGQVLDENEKPAAGVRVSVLGADQPTESVVSDAEGRFRLKACEGAVRVSAFGDRKYCTVSADSGETNLVLQLRQMRLSSVITKTTASKPVSLKGKPLPSLAPAGLAEAAPAGKPVLVCLLDGEQRPSRRFLRQLGEQAEALKKKGLTVLAIQAAPIPTESLQSWTNSAPPPCPLGLIREKSPDTAWATGVSTLPWLILRDAKGNVSAEGFPFEELEANLKALSE